MDRRTFLAGTGAVLLAAPLAAEAQQAKKVYRIGYLSCRLSDRHRLSASFLQGSPRPWVCREVEISSWSTACAEGQA